MVRLQIFHLSVWELREAFVHIPSEEGLSWELRVFANLFRSLVRMPSHTRSISSSYQAGLSWLSPLSALLAHHNNLQLIPVDVMWFQNQHRPFSWIMRCNLVKLLCVNDIACQSPGMRHMTERFPFSALEFQPRRCLFPSEQTSVFLIKHLRGCCGLMHRWIMADCGRVHMCFC